MKLLQIYRNFMLYRLKSGQLLINPVLSQNFSGIGTKLEKMMYFCIIIGLATNLCELIGCEMQPNEHLITDSASQIREHKYENDSCVQNL